MSGPRPTRAHLHLAASMTLVGLSVPASKVVAEAMPPFLAAWIRFALVAVVMLPLACRGSGAFPKSGADWTNVALLAFFGGAMFNVLLLYGLGSTSAVSAGIITSTIPAAMAACAALILGERVTRSGALGIALAVLGIAALTLRPGSQGGPADSLLGNALVFGAVVSEGLYGVFARRLGGRVGALPLAFLANASSAVMIAPAALAVSWGFEPGSVAPGVWGLLAATGLASGLLAVVLWMRGIAHVPASRAGLFTGLVPAASVLAAVVFLGEAFTAGHAFGLVCVLLGIYLGTRR